jgi:hypothetical protein
MEIKMAEPRFVTLPHPDELLSRGYDYSDVGQILASWETFDDNRKAHFLRPREEFHIIEPGIEPMHLGDLIAALKAAPQDSLCQFDFCGFFPVGTGSYRGRYADLVLHYNDPHDHKTQTPKVAEVIKLLEAAIGQTYGGWKGGDFTMHEHVPVWVDDSADSNETGVVAVKPDTYFTYIQTANFR